MRLLLLSRYGRLGASSRLRSYQYLPYLESQGIEITVAPLLGDDYVTGLYQGRVPLASVMKSYWTRWQWLRRVTEFDAVWVEKEMLPWIPAGLELGGFPKDIPLIADYDDAVFHRYDQHRRAIVRTVLGRKIDAVMRRANVVMAGNEYLANRARQAGAQRVEMLPTVVDTERYQIRPPPESPTITIAWMGSPATAHYLHRLAPVLPALAATHPIRWVAVGANPAQLKSLPFTVLPWTEASEVADIQPFDIGIMPLPDEPFERGKCGYKLIQYMACGKPVVASPVGVNSVIVRNGVEGFLASSTDEWIASLQKLVDDSALRKQMGQAGRVRVEAEYSLQVTVPKLERLLRSVMINAAP